MGRRHNSDIANKSTSQPANNSAKRLKYCREISRCGMFDLHILLFRLKVHTTTFFGYERFQKKKDCTVQCVASSLLAERLFDKASISWHEKLCVNYFNKLNCMPKRTYADLAKRANERASKRTHAM